MIQSMIFTTATTDDGKFHAYLEADGEKRIGPPRDTLEEAEHDRDQAMKIGESIFKRIFPNSVISVGKVQ